MSEKGKKQSKEEVKEKTGQISRREFLKDAGLIVGGATIGSMAILSARGGGEATSTITQTVTKTSTTTVTQPGGTGATITVTSPPITKVVETKAPGLITLKVNGDSHLVEVKANWSLNYVIREKLGLVGTKRGCDSGQCGVCTVIMDHRPVMSCMVLAVEAEGKDIETVEGLDTGGKLHPLQQAFIDNDAMQCGFCTPGQVMTAKALLDINPKPSADQVKEAMAGTLCRCGCYRNILAAVLAAAK